MRNAFAEDYMIYITFESRLVYESTCNAPTGEESRSVRGGKAWSGEKGEDREGRKRGEMRAKAR
jgi:hypothetical protein